MRHICCIFFHSTALASTSGYCLWELKRNLKVVFAWCTNLVQCAKFHRVTAWLHVTPMVWLNYGMSVQWGVCRPRTLGPTQPNRVAFDPSGTVLSIASNDGAVKMYEVATGKVTPLTGHEDAVQSVLFDRAGEFLLSAGSDGTIRIWS